MNLPNLLTLLRIILVPVFLYMLFQPDILMRIGALAVFAFASFTDLLDGWLARKLNQESAFGKFFDPLADKFLVIATLIGFVALDKFIPMWMVLVIIARDVLITLMRYCAIKKGTSLRTSRFGKVKTAFQMISIVVIIMIFIVRSYGIDIHPDSYIKLATVHDVLASDHPHKWIIVMPYCLMAMVTALTALSGIRYLITNGRLLLPPYSPKKDGEK